MSFFKLPNEVLIKIFQFDSTYHNFYSKLINEFNEKTNFWRIKWKNYNDNKYIVYKYKLNRLDVKRIIKYFYLDNFRFENNNMIPTDSFITDDEIGCHCKILNNIIKKN